MMFNISAFPSLIFLKNQKVVAKRLGILSAEAIERYAKRHFK